MAVDATPDPLRISVTSRSEMDAELQDYVSVLAKRVLRHGGGGILVTRHSHEDFTIEVSNRVPFGETQEIDCR